MAAEKRTVLIIDDEELNLKLVRKLLAMEGCLVVEARNAASGVELARSSRPSLILMDIRLPDMDGLAATRILKGDPVTRDVPIVVLSAYAMEEDKARAAEAGCAGYITKPFELQAFRRTIRQFLGVR